MRIFLILTAILMGSSALGGAGAVQVFENRGGIKLVLVEMSNPKHFAADISGTRTDLDRIPLLLEVDTTNPRKYDYKVANAAKDRFVLIQEPTGNIQVIIPGQKEHPFLTSNPKLAAKTNGEAVLNELFYRVTANSKNGKSDNDAAVTDAAKKAAATCGTTLQGKIDWAGFQKMAGKYLVGNMCAAALSGINDVCSDAEGKGAIKKSVSSVTCRYGNAGSFQLKSKELVVSLKEDTPNQSRNLQDFLENNL